MLNGRYLYTGRDAGLRSGEVLVNDAESTETFSSAQDAIAISWDACECAVGLHIAGARISGLYVEDQVGRHYVGEAALTS